MECLLCLYISHSPTETGKPHSNTAIIHIIINLEQKWRRLRESMYLWTSTNRNHIQELNLIWDPSLYSLQHVVLTKHKGLQSAMRQNPFQSRAYVSTYSWHKSWFWSCYCCCSQEEELTGLEFPPGWSVRGCEGEDILPSVCQQQLLRKHQVLTVPASGIPGREIPAMQTPGTASNLNLGE